MGWIGFDLDATLALWGWEVDPLTGYRHYDVTAIGPPIPLMVERCKALIAEGKEVRIFTARVGPASDDECLNALAKVTEARAAAVAMPPFIEARMSPQAYWNEYQQSLIERWCAEHIGTVLPITATKDFHMYLLYDDRCIQVISNTGRTMEEERDMWQGRVLRGSGEAV